ncbi:MAG: lipoyl domain-containing protein [bacterium]
MTERRVEAPDLGATEIIVTRWFKNLGDAVPDGDDLVELEVDKAAYILPAPVGGKLIAIHAPPAAKVKAGDLLATLEIP